MLFLKYPIAIRPIMASMHSSEIIIDVVDVVEDGEFLVDSS